MLSHETFWAFQPFLVHAVPEAHGVNEIPRMAVIIANTIAILIWTVVFMYKNRFIAKMCMILTYKIDISVLSLSLVCG